MVDKLGCEMVLSLIQWLAAARLLLSYPLQVVVAYGDTEFGLNLVSAGVFWVISLLYLMGFFLKEEYQIFLEDLIDSFLQWIIDRIPILILINNYIDQKLRVRLKTQALSI